MTDRRAIVMPTGLLVGFGVLAGIALGPIGIPLAIIGTFAVMALGGEGGLSRNSIWRPLLIVAVCSLLGVVRLAMSTNDLQSDHPDLVTSLIGSTGAEGVVTTMPQSGRFVAEIVSVKRSLGDEPLPNTRVLVFLPSYFEVNLGDRLKMIWSFQTISSLPPGFGGYVRAQNVLGVANVWVVETLATGHSPLRVLVDARRAVSTRLERLIPGDAGALASGIVTGDDSGLAGKTLDAFQHTGTSHVTAVSGQNVAMLLTMWSFLFRPHIRKRLIVMQIAIVVLILAYVGLVGWGPSSLRAALFAIMVVFASRHGRRPDMSTVLALTIAVMLIVDPSLISTLAFWLSVVSSAALITSLHWRGKTNVSSKVGGIVIALMAAQLATVPITVATFGTWSLGSVVANLAIAPLVALAFPLSFVLALLAFIAPVVAEHVAIVPKIVLDLVVTIVQRVDARFGIIDLEAMGSVAVIAITILCLSLLAAMSVDIRRWFQRLHTHPGPLRLGILGGWVFICASATYVILELVA